MKKICGLLSLLAVLTIMACGDDKPTEVKKEVIIVPVNQNPPAEKNTTITLDKNGVKVSTNKVDVKIEPDKKKN